MENRDEWLVNFAIYSVYDNRGFIKFYCVSVEFKERYVLVQLSSNLTLLETIAYGDGQPHDLLPLYSVNIKLNFDIHYLSIFLSGRTTSNIISHSVYSFVVHYF